MDFAKPGEARLASAAGNAIEPPLTTDCVFTRFAPELRRIAVRHFNLRPEDADDLVSAVFTSFLVNRDHVRGDPRAYLLGAIFNASRKFQRRRRTLEGQFDPDVARIEAIAIDDRIFDRLSANVLASATIRELRASDSRCADAICRAYLEGQPTDEIAFALNTSRTNVNYLLHKCRKKAQEIYRRLVGVTE